MSAAAIGCLILGLSALVLCILAWYRRFCFSGVGLASGTDGGMRNGLALSALLCATTSTAIYVTFLLLWVYSHFFNGQQPLGAAAIWVGLLLAVYAFAAGLFARGIARVLIVISSAAAAFLWLLAGAASAAV